MLFGRSGGGLHIANHLTLPKSAPFFQAAVMQSGSFSTRTAKDLVTQTSFYNEVADALGCFGSEQTVKLTTEKKKTVSGYFIMLFFALSPSFVFSSAVLPSDHLCLGDGGFFSRWCSPNKPFSMFLWNKKKKQVLNCLRREPFQRIVDVQFDITGEWEPCIDGVVKKKINNSIKICFFVILQFVGLSLSLSVCGLAYVM